MRHEVTELVVPARPTAVVVAWCSTGDHHRAGPRWEVHRDGQADASMLETEVFHLVSGRTPNCS